MPPMTKKQIDYLDPLLTDIEQRVRMVYNRMVEKPIREWGTSEFWMVESATRQLHEDTKFVTTALGVISDIKRGELAPED